MLLSFIYLFFGGGGGGGIKLNKEHACLVGEAFPL